MKAEVAALVEAFTREIREAVRLELMEEMRAFSEGRQKREVRRRRDFLPVTGNKSRRKKRRAKRSGGVAQLPRRKGAGRGARKPRDASTGVGKPADAGESPAPASFPFKMEDLDVSALLASERTEEIPPLSPAEPPRPPVTMVPVPTPYPVVIRWDGKRHPRIALLVARSEDGEFFAVRLAQGRNRRYSRKVRRIIAAELVRDATDREAVLGVVPFDAPPAAVSA